MCDLSAIYDAMPIKDHVHERAGGADRGLGWLALSAAALGHARPAIGTTAPATVPLNKSESIGREHARPIPIKH